MDGDDRERPPDQPCPVGNRWGPEINRLNTELMAVRHRMDAYELSQALHNRAILESEAKLTAMATHEIRLDRIEQRGLNTKETWLLFIAAIGSAASLAAVLWK